MTMQRGVGGSNTYTTTNNFTVEDESDAIDAGRLVGLTQDFYGRDVPFGGGPDIGMAESDIVAVPTSVNYSDEDGNKYLSVYPNPSNGLFSMAFENRKTGPAEILINSVTGTTIYQKLIETKGMYVSDIDLSGSPKGLYYLSIMAEDEIFTQKIVIK